MGLLTTAVGAFPKPSELRAARWRFAEGQLDLAGLREAEEPAIRQAMELQSSCGVDLAVDSQLDRADLVGFFAQGLDGVEPGALVRCYGNRYYKRPRIVGEVGRREPLTVEGWRRAQALAGKPVRAVITGPYTLMDWSFDEHYGSREACCRALAEIVRQEASDLLAAGATEIQIDEPAISARPDELPWASEALGQVTAPLAGKARTWAHVCYGDYGPVLPGLLHLPVDVIHLDVAADQTDLLAALPEDKTFAAGVVEAARSEVESVDEIRARIDGVLRYVPAERLIVAPDAGLQGLTAEQARAKLVNLVEAARGR